MSPNCGGLQHCAQRITKNLKVFELIRCFLIMDARKSEKKGRKSFNNVGGPKVQKQHIMRMPDQLERREIKDLKGAIARSRTNFNQLQLSHARSHKAATSIIHLQSAGLSLFGDSSKSFSAMYQFSLQASSYRQYRQTGNNTQYRQVQSQVMKRTRTLGCQPAIPKRQVFTTTTIQMIHQYTPCSDTII